MLHHDTLAVLDFGGQYAHLIANRVRRLGVYSEIVEADTPAAQLRQYKGILLSGGPNSVYERGAPHCDPTLFELGIPVLGICYGHQLMQHLLGGRVVPGKTKEYGGAEISFTTRDDLFFKGIGGSQKRTRVWMSHGDNVQVLAPGFMELAASEDLPHSAVFDPERRLYGVQFHVEVVHTPEGMGMLDNFLKICDVSRDWDMKHFMRQEIETIVQKVGDKKVFLLVSGGVDSAVAFALLEKALGADRVFGVLVDTGLMRLNEAEKVKKALSAAGFSNLHVADKRETFLNRLKGVTEPEQKRKIIGELFWQVKEEVAEELKLNPDEWIVAQGTIYPDTIETGGTKHASTIKTHHNRVDLMQELIAQGKVIEPLAPLYKDEVRELGAELGLPPEIVQRQPFPGPGLGVRILCVSAEEEKNQTTFEELNAKIEIFARERFGLADLTARVLPIKSVGVQGDSRTYRHPVALFTVCEDWDLLERISTDITNRFFEVNRVVVQITNYQLPITNYQLRIHAADLSPQRVALLQRVDDIVQETMKDKMGLFAIWQFPVVLMPTYALSGRASAGRPVGGESIVLRPVESTEAMTARFARIDWGLLHSMTKAILREPGISQVFYDLTHKPPGTIEWE